MKEEVVIKKLMDYLSSAESFLGAEIPELLQQILTYDYYSNLFGAFIFGLITVFFLGIADKGLQKRDTVAWGWCCFIALFCFIIACVDINAMIKIKTAPKYYLVCKLKELVK